MSITVGSPTWRQGQGTATLEERDQREWTRCAFVGNCADQSAPRSRIAFRLRFPLKALAGSVFGRTDFRGFLFGPPDFFRGFCRPTFSPGKKVPRKILQENRRQNAPKFMQQKSPTHSSRKPGQDSHIARNSAMRIGYMRLNRRKDSRSLAIFDRKEIANLGALRFAWFKICGEQNRSLPHPQRIARFWCTQLLTPIPSFFLKPLKWVLFCTMKD